MRLTIALFTTIIGAVLCFGACNQAEVIADKVIAKINEKIGKHEIQLKEAEKQLKRLKEAQRKAKISARQSSKSIGTYETEVKRAQATVDELKDKRDKLKAIKAKGAPYKTSKGRELTKSDLLKLTAKVTSRLTVAESKLRTSQQALKVTQRSTQGNSSVSDQLATRIVELEGKIEILRNNLALLKQMEEQRKLKSDYDTKAAQGILSEMDRTISELDTTIEVDLEEVFDEQTSTADGNTTGLSASDNDILDEL